MEYVAQVLWTPYERRRSSIAYLNGSLEFRIVSMELHQGQSVLERRVPAPHRVWFVIGQVRRHKAPWDSVGPSVPLGRLETEFNFEHLGQFPGAGSRLL